MFDTPLGITLFIIICVLALILITLLNFYLVGHILRLAILTRSHKNKWTRGCPVKEPLQIEMYDIGQKWHDANVASKKELHIENEGFNLYGEYFDFGFDRALIFVSGRTEALGYGYYFVQPYKELGYNVFVFDQRAHGHSDGKYNTLGFEEHKDLIKWAELLHDTYGNKSILLHGICIGSSCCLQALVSDKCPDYICGMIADGMYTRFYDSFKNHLVKFKQPKNLLTPFVNMSFKLATGHTMRIGNIDFIDKLTKPILFIHSKKDRYSVPSMAEALYAKVSHDKKKLVWFEDGAHSRLRPVDTERYDGAIKEFLAEHFEEVKA